jgi:replication factor A3
MERKRLILGDLVDFEAVKAVVDATHRYKEIFYTE